MVTGQKTILAYANKDNVIECFSGVNLDVAEAKNWAIVQILAGKRRESGCGDSEKNT